jgi:hypothetical protein
MADEDCILLHMIPTEPNDTSLQQAATAPPVAPLLQSATTAPPPVNAATAPLLQDATTAPPVAPMLQSATTAPPPVNTETAPLLLQSATTAPPPVNAATETAPPPQHEETDPPPDAATATKSDPPPDAATATTTVQDAAATATTRKHGRKRNANFLSADNTGGTNLGDSVAERRKLTPRACVNKKQGEEAKSPQRKKTKGRRLEQSMENDGEGEVHDENEDGKEASQLQDDKEASQLQDDIVEEEDDDQDEKDEEEEESEEEEDVDDLTTDDLEIIQQNKEVIDVDADDAVDFDAAGFSAQNEIKQDQILKSTAMLLNMDFLPLSFFIHSTDNFLICAYFLCSLIFSVFLKFSKLQTELIFFDFFCFSEFSITKKYLCFNSNPSNQVSLK